MPSFREFLEENKDVLKEVDILFVGEQHFNPRPREILGLSANTLAELEFKFYGMEAPLHDTKVYGPKSLISLQPGKEHQSTYLDVAFRMTEAGITPFRYDIRRHPDFSSLGEREKEEKMADLIEEKVRNGRCVVLCGMYHAVNKEDTLRGILENRGYRCLSYPFDYEKFRDNLYALEEFTKQNDLYYGNFHPYHLKPKYHYCNIKPIPTKIFTKD